MLVEGLSGTQAQEIAKFTSAGKQSAWGYADILANGIAVQLIGIHAARQLNPQNVATGGFADTCAGGEMRKHGTARGLQLFSTGASETSQVHSAVLKGEHDEDDLTSCRRPGSRT